MDRAQSCQVRQGPGQLQVVGQGQGGQAGQARPLDQEQSFNMVLELGSTPKAILPELPRHHKGGFKTVNLRSLPSQYMRLVHSVPVQAGTMGLSRERRVRHGHMELTEEEKLVKVVIYPQFEFYLN